MMNLDSKEATSRDETQNGGGMSQAQFALLNSDRLQSDLEVMGNTIKQYQDNFKFLKAQKNKLDETILDLQVHMGKIHSSGTHRNKSYDSNLHGEDINEQILRHVNSAAGVLSHVRSRHYPQASQLDITNGVVGVVAKLGKVNDENLSQEYKSVKRLESYDNKGNVDRNAAIHGLASSIGRTISMRPFRCHLS